MQDRTLTVALAGNPNSGKTTIFNVLTGARQHVGNYAGVTVEKKEGVAWAGDTPVRVIDLPGTYSLTAYSVEEVVARNVILEERPDVVVDIVDASNLERNLYLATQLMELGVPVVLAFNMIDMARDRGVRIDIEKLSLLLGVPIVATVGSRGEGVQEILAAAIRVGTDPAAAVAAQRHPTYGHEVEPHVQEMAELLRRCPEAMRHRRWFAVKLLEGDAETIKRLGRLCPDQVDDFQARAAELGRHIERMCGDPPEIMLADRRYGYIAGACAESVSHTGQARRAWSDQIDAVLTNRVVGLPIFAAMMYMVFQLTFTLGEPPMNWIDATFGFAGGWLNAHWPGGEGSVLRSLLVDGIIGGVGGVIVFLPNIVLLFLAIALLEDTGYMARAAFIVDRLMHKIGLHGKSFIPMLTGFGCSVPGILATRTLESPRDRLTTMLIMPLMSCGARLPIYALIIPAFFAPHWRAPMLWLIYVIGIALAVVLAKLLRVTVLRGASMPFVLELPPYRMPTVRGLAMHMWERTRLYVQKAGTVILGLSILMWAVSTFPRKQQFDVDYDDALAAAAGQYTAERDAWADASSLGPARADVLDRLAAELPGPVDTSAGGADAAPADADAIPPAVIARAEALLAVRARIVQAQTQFDQTVGESQLADGSPGYIEALHLRSEQFDRARQVNPELFNAAMRYRTQIEQPYLAASAELRARREAERLRHTIAGRIGHGIEPVLRPMGFDWRIGTAMIGAMAAKEVFVAQMGIVFAAGDADSNPDSLRRQLRESYSPLVGFCVMLFALIGAPCVATTAATRKESGRWSWALLQFGGLTLLAYVATVIVYQIGRVVG